MPAGSLMVRSIPCVQSLDTEFEQKASLQCSFLERELMRSHRANPNLVQSLLAARHFHETNTAAKYTLPLSLIAGICQFQQRFKWLCPWGGEYVAEFDRDESCYPQSIRTRIHHVGDIYDVHPAGLPLTQPTVQRAIEDTAARWERVVIVRHRLECLENLHRHPCEELHILHSTMRFSDIQRIVKCQSLRVLTLQKTKVTNVMLQMLHALKNLTTLVVYNEKPHIPRYFSKFSQFERLESIDVIDSDADRMLMPSEVSDTVKFLEDRRDKLRSVNFHFPMEPAIAAALGKCTQLEVVNLSSPENNDYELEAFFASATAQRTVRVLRLAWTEITGYSCRYLAQFRNLRTLDFAFVKYLQTGYLAAILLRNAAHIEDVNVCDCKISDEILEVVAQCRVLSQIDLRDTKVTRAAIEEYKRLKRPNHEAIVYSDEECRRRNKASQQISDRHEKG